MYDTSLKFTACVDWGIICECCDEIIDDLRQASRWILMWLKRLVRSFVEVRHKILIPTSQFHHEQRDLFIVIILVLDRECG